MSTSRDGLQRALKALRDEHARGTRIRADDGVLEGLAIGAKVVEKLLEDPNLDTCICCARCCEQCHCGYRRRAKERTR